MIKQFLKRQGKLYRIRHLVQKHGVLFATYVDESGRKVEAVYTLPNLTLVGE